MAEIKVLEEVRNASGEQRRSAQWYQEQVKSIVGTSYAATRFQQDYAENLSNRMLPGRMYLINYSNPVGKGTPALPYYDMFPLILPFNIESSHITAINFHYLHPASRVILLEKLSRFKLGDTDIQTRIRADWGILSNFARFREVRPSVKRYVKSRIKGRYLFIQPDDWTTAAVLPTEQFRGASKQKVYLDSNRKMRQR
tara:strand:+ start:874 stop:1467 length:594 start_codon:yes stop_codon:yes gene_type:complete